MTVSVDKDKCIGCGVCVSLCPQIFELKEGKSHVKEEDPDDMDCAEKAESSCPVDAITVE